MPTATDIKKGKIIVHEDELWRCLDFIHKTPGNLRGFVQATLRNLKSGAKVTHRFRSTDKIEFAFIETREYQFLYRDGDLFHFMDVETYEQSALESEMLGDAPNYMRDGDMIQMERYDGMPVGVSLPNHVELKVAQTGPGTRGDTVSNVFKDAKLETGITIKVPLFIETGEMIKVDTRTGEFVERVK